MANALQRKLHPEDVTWIERLASVSVALLLLIGCFLIISPFLSAALWSVVLCASTWRLFERLDHLLGDHRTLAALIMTLGLTAGIVAPFAIVGVSLVGEVKIFAAVVKQSIENEPLSLPVWLGKIPMVGPQLSAGYRALVGSELSLVDQAKQLSGPVGTTILEWSKALGSGLWQLLLSLLIGFFFYRDGQALGARISNLAARVAGAERGERLLKLAQDTCVGVVYGVVGTGLLEAVLMGLGLMIAGVPGALILGFVTFLLSAFPGGAAIIWIPAAIWLAWQGHGGWALFLAVWELVFNFLIEGLLRPLFIAESGGVPLLLVFIGIFGGAVAFGFIGVFLGPALLAVGYSLIDDVTREAPLV